MNPTKDYTAISMRALDPSLMVPEADSKAKYIAERPAFSFGQLRSQFSHMVMWTSVLERDLKKITPTQWDNERDNGDFRMSDSKVMLKRYLHRPPVPETPMIINDPQAGVCVMWKRTPGVASEIVGIAWGAVMTCVNCSTMATEETAAQYKMCKRCRDSVGVAVWYCSPECQEENYVLHRRICKSASRAAEVMDQCVRVAAEGDTRAMCTNCGVSPTKATVHTFTKCQRCKRCAVATLYCGLDCQRAHYPVHVKDCHERMFAHEKSSSMLLDVMHRVDDGGFGSLDATELAVYEDLTGNPFHGVARREHSAALLKSVVERFGLSDLGAAMTRVSMGGPEEKVDEP